MAKKMLLTIDNNQKKIKKPLLTIDGVHKTIKKAFVTVNGVHKLVLSDEMSLAELPVGSSVFMNVNNTPTEFLIVHQGLPDATMYDASCDGTWLLMKDVYGDDDDDVMFGTNVDDYQTSDVRVKLNDIVFFAFDVNIQNLIKQVKIPYYKRYQAVSGAKVEYGANGLPSKLFLLSGYEVGWTDADGDFAAEGVVLDYFKDCAKEDMKRAAYRNGNSAGWWLRSILPNSYKRAWDVFDGEAWNDTFNTWCAIRPALILPSTTIVDDNFNIIA